MFKDISELKEFILWAKQEKIQALKVDNVEIAFSAYAFLDPVAGELAPAPTRPPTQAEIEALVKEEQDLLFHSAT